MVCTTVVHSKQESARGGRLCVYGVYYRVHSKQESAAVFLQMNWMVMMMVVNNWGVEPMVKCY